MRIRVLLLLAIGLAVITGCGAKASVARTQPAPTQPQLCGTLTVFAASSLADAFAELGKQFEADHLGSRVVYNLAGSQALSAQLGEGAPADVFASANMREMANAIAADRVIDGSQAAFAHNKLVVIFPKDNPAGLARLQDLANSGLKLVLAAAEVPVGRYALEFLYKASQDAAFGTAFKDHVLMNIVSYEDNVKSVASKVMLGEADAGIVYLTDISSDSAEEVGRLDIPDALNALATYPIAVVSDSTHPELAQAFIELVLSEQGQAILVRYGFLPPNYPDRR